MSDKNKLHFNPAQLKYWLIRALVMVLFYGRATGKTAGPGALATSSNMNSMPQGNHAIGTTSYEKVMEDVLPKLITTWEKMGYHRDRHFWVRSYAPDKLRIPKPFSAPIKPTHVVHWWNGACGKLISVDRPNTFLGKDHDSMYLDEVRKTKQEMVMELVKTIRGNKDIFGHLFNHGSILMTTDLPKMGEADWLLNYEKEVDHEKVDMILMAQQYISGLKEEQGDAGKRKFKALEKEIQEIEANINELRKNLISVLYASTLDNVHVLGLETIESWKRQLSDAEFATSILSIMVKQHGKYFYSNFSETLNTYTDTNEEYIDNTSYDELQSSRNCRKDADLELRQPLHISPDYNGKFNCVAVGQRVSMTRVNVVSAFSVGAKGKIRGLVKKFDRYYQYKKAFNNTVYIHYDQTAIGDNAKDDISYIDEWKSELIKLGWNVIDNYVGASPTHRSRYILTKKAFDYTDHEISDFYINSNNCEDLIISIAQAKIKMVDGKTKKDKWSENSKTVPPQHATHFSEAFDLLLWGMERHKIGSSLEFLDVLAAQ